MVSLVTSGHLSFTEEKEWGRTTTKNAVTSPQILKKSFRTCKFGKQNTQSNTFMKLFTLSPKKNPPKQPHYLTLHCEDCRTQPYARTSCAVKTSEDLLIRDGSKSSWDLPLTDQGVQRYLREKSTRYRWGGNKQKNLRHQSLRFFTIWMCVNIKVEKVGIW